MNKTLSTVAFLLYGLSVGQTQPIDVDEKGIAFIQLNSSEEGLLFYIDDSLVGALTGNEFEIISGFHKLKV